MATYPIERCVTKNVQKLFFKSGKNLVHQLEKSQNDINKKG